MIINHQFVKFKH